MIYKFGPCEPGKAHGRPMSQQSRALLEKAHPGSTCPIETKDHRTVYYRKDSAKALNTSVTKSSE